MTATVPGRDEAGVARVSKVPVPALELRGLTKRFGQTTAVDDVDFTVAEGESVALLGPSGSGKTTMLGLISGFLAATSGQILLRARDISGLPPAARNIGVVFQHYALFPHLTVEDNVSYGLKMRGWNRRDRRQRAGEMLEIVGLGGMNGRHPRQLSGGQQQRVALARALAFEPTMLLLDEPLGALDREIRFQMQAEIRRVHRQVGTTMIHVTHDKEEALALGDRIAIMRIGRLVSADTPSGLFARPASSFVASFFCGYNLLPADVVELVSEDFARVRWREDVIEVRRGSVSSSACMLAIPPSCLALSRRPDMPRRPGHIELAVVVDDVLYLGDTTEITAHTVDGHRITARVPSQEVGSTRPTEPLTLTTTIGSLLLVPAEQ